MATSAVPAMIDAAWDEYRGWAARARELQGKLRRWNLAALASAVAAAVFGGLAVQFGEWPLPWPTWGKYAAGAAAVAAALTPIIGREMLSSGVERRWQRARALAEGIKSECFRFAARLTPYDAEDAAARFLAWRTTLAGAAAHDRVTPVADPAPPTGDKRRPPADLEAGWYLERRLRDQRAYYDKGRRTNEVAAMRLRLASGGASALAAILAGVAAADLARKDFPLTAWVGVCVTIAAAIVAVGLLEKRHYLAAEYGLMTIALDRIEEAWTAGLLQFGALVDQTESLLGAEHAAWVQAMARFQSGPPPAR
jgi:heme A synthase